jgi:hypothetical protein
MIISASRRTDIPAFYYPWLLNRFSQGEVWVPNPFNARQLTVVPLTADKLDAVVLWSKNPAALLTLGPPPYPWYMQYTLNDYPAAFEPSLPALEQRVQTFRQLSRQYGSEHMVWRYDPIVLTPERGPLQHLRAFTALCRSLEGATDQVVLSFLDEYRKIRPWINRMGVYFPTLDQRRELILSMADIARASGITPTACCEADLPLPPARCVDPERLARLAGPLQLSADTGQRPGCGCAASIDIGRYDCCLHGCGYCYATASSRVSALHHREHDLQSPLLWGKPPENALFKYPAYSSQKALI